MPTELPPLEAVTRLVAELEARGCVVALGGSAVLAWLGLVDRVNDWDVTTDAPTQNVVEAIKAAGLQHRVAPERDGVFATRERLVVDAGDHHLDVLVGFAARDGDRVVPFPVRVAGRWRGLPMADPAVWARAYRLIGRPERAKPLERWLAARPPGEN